MDRLISENHIKIMRNYLSNSMVGIFEKIMIDASLNEDIKKPNIFTPFISTMLN